MCLLANDNLDRIEVGDTITMHVLNYEKERAVVIRLPTFFSNVWIVRTVDDGQLMYVKDYNSLVLFSKVKRGNYNDT